MTMVVMVMVKVMVTMMVTMMMTPAMPGPAWRGTLPWAAPSMMPGRSRSWIFAPRCSITPGILGEG